MLCAILLPPFPLALLPETESKYRQYVKKKIKHHRYRVYHLQDRRKISASILVTKLKYASYPTAGLVTELKSAYGPAQLHHSEPMPHKTSGAHIV